MISMPIKGRFSKMSVCKFLLMHGMVIIAACLPMGRPDQESPIQW